MDIAIPFVSVRFLEEIRRVLAMAKRGAKVIFPDVFKIYQGLEQQLRQNTFVSESSETEK